jgi:hypothetical protein
MMFSSEKLISAIHVMKKLLKHVLRLLSECNLFGQPAFLFNWT